MHHLALFIRRTITNSRKTAQPYYTHRLVEGVRTGSVVRQTTLLNLGSEFDVPQSDWPLLAARIDALLHGQESLALEPLSEVVETLAQRCAAKLIALRPAPAENPGAPSASVGSFDAGRFQEVDLESIEMVRPRSVGTLQAALSAMRACGFEDVGPARLEPPADRRRSGPHRWPHGASGQRTRHPCVAAKALGPG